MSERAETLANLFSAELEGLLTLAEGCTPAQWQQTTPDEGWPVGVVAHHVAVSFPVITKWIQKVAAGRPVSLPRSAIDEANAHHAQEAPNYSQTETIALLRSNGAAILVAIRALSADELQQSATMAPAEGRALTADQVIRHILIHHVQEHKGHIQQAL